MPAFRWVWRVSFIAAMACALPCAAQLDQIGPIDGDLNADSYVGIDDLIIVLVNWSQVVTPGDKLNGDADGDGVVGVDDLNLVLANLGTGYPLPQQRNMSLGVNLAEVTYYNREWVFVDAIKQAQPWVSTNPNGNPFDTGDTVQTDVDGWPLLDLGQAAQTIMFSQTQGAYPAGVYVCTYEGKGTLQFQWDGKAISSSPGRIEVDVTPSDAGILMRIASSDPTDQIRNIKLWMPGFEGAASSFHPLFIQRLSKFKVLRFMDWKLINNVQPGISWQGRTLPSYYSQHAPNGVAVEYMIELCNELGVDPWFCMPHTADDDYIESFAALVAGGLNPDRKVYIEWSNEVWNSRFDAYGWVSAQSGSAPFSDGWFNLWAQRVSDTFSIWEQAFAGQEGRLVRVAAGQAANVWVTRNLTDRLVGQLDAVSCSGYFDDSNADFDATTTAQDVIADATDRAIPERSAKFYQNHGDLTQNLTNSLGRTIRLIGYEGGQHYADDNRNLPYAQAFLDMQYLPQMFNVYLQNLGAFEQAGGDLMTVFNFVDRPGNHGAWGHLEHQDDSLDVSPKFKALLYYIKDQ
jgi:hypothetical protein